MEQIDEFDERSNSIQHLLEEVQHKNGLGEEEMQDHSADHF